MDTGEENQPERINQNEIPPLVRRSTQHAAPINGLEATKIGKMYHTNNVIPKKCERK